MYCIIYLSHIQLHYIYRHQFDQDTTFYSKCEKTFGRVQRTIPIPELADAENISVQFNNGVLEISLPKKEEAVSRKLPIS